MGQADLRRWKIGDVVRLRESPVEMLVVDWTDNHVITAFRWGSIHEGAYRPDKLVFIRSPAR
jgi:hypothetical protein